MDVAGERHVDCNLAAGCTFLSEGPCSGWGCPGKGALQILVANALKGVIAVEVVSTHVVGRAGVADPTQADRSELALWIRERLGRIPQAPPPTYPLVHPHTTHRELGHGLPGGIR